MYPTHFLTPGVKDFAEQIDAERQKQIARFGDQRHPDGTHTHNKDFADDARRACQQADANGEVTWADILSEEYWEALAESDPVKLRAELIQIAGVCAAWIHDIDQRPTG